jgi:hypothetical protein
VGALLLITILGLQFAGKLESSHISISLAEPPDPDRVGASTSRDGLHCIVVSILPDARYSRNDEDVEGGKVENPTNQMMMMMMMRTLYETAVLRAPQTPLRALP